MLEIAAIKVRDIKELQGGNIVLPKNTLTPLKKRKNARSDTTSKKLKQQERDNETVTHNDIATTSPLAKKSRKSLLKSALKETPSNQKRIDSYFTSCPKTYVIKLPKEELAVPFRTSRAKTSTKNKNNSGNTCASKKSKKSPGRPKGRRKRLFTDSTEPSAESMSTLNAIECITIDSDCEDENVVKNEIASSINRTAVVKNGLTLGTISPPDSYKASLKSSSPTTASSLSFGQRMSKTSCENTKSSHPSSSNVNSFTRRKTKPCPAYKVIENTTFAVDAFQFGYIENVTHYFLTHFHADHYIGLTKSFAMPLFVSPVTARLLRTFIPVQEQYIHELELNKSYKIKDMEVTALDANHCPGSILLVFRFPDTNKCILHTGDFRASHEMESEPIFWDYDIHTIYLDTTYISDKYAFCSQYESIMKAQDLINKFLDKHSGKRILYICGSYVIGKEKFWSSLAEKYVMKVWAEGNRSKALKAINEERFNSLLVEDPNDANMHIIPMGKLSYLELIEYFKAYEQQYDIVFAIRPSGWEKDTKPRYGAKINVVGVEYSEHSSYEEMQRFVKFLKPEQVISTVPTGKDLTKTSKIPLHWYKYDELKPSSNYQPSLHSFLVKTPHKKTSIRLPNINKGGVETFVSPIQFSANTSTKESLIRNSPLNLQDNQITTKNKTVTTAISITNSSEDFEKSDFIPKTQQNIKKQSPEKVKNNSPREKKTQRNQKQPPLTSTNIASATNSEEYFEVPEMKLEKKNTKKASKEVNNKIKTDNKKLENSNSRKHSSENNLYSYQNNIQQELENPTSQKRKTKRKNALNKSTKDTSTNKVKCSENKCNKSLNSKSQLDSTAAQENHLYNSIINPLIDSASDDEIQASDKHMKGNDFTIAPSQKRITRSKSASTKATSDSFDLQKKVEDPTDKINFNTYEENRIYQSKSNSAVDTASVNKMQFESFNNKEIKSNSPISSEDWLIKSEYPTTSARCKRSNINLRLSPCKKSKPSIHTHDILNNILKQRDDLDRFNCSQLAGLVVEAVNKHNPDNSKDHIPADLLSDADDDWI